MPGKWILSPSLLSADMTKLGEQIIALERAGVDWLHVDVMDGHFAPNICMGPIMVETFRKVSSLPIDVHLMIENPDRYIEDFAKAGASIITIHIETGYNPYRTLNRIRDLGCRPGIAINPGTPPSAITEMLPIVDLILILGTNPGFSGQTFIPQVLQKITSIRSSNTDMLIQVDGGMNADTLPLAYNAGANVFVAGNAVFKNPYGIENGVKTMRALI